MLLFIFLYSPLLFISAFNHYFLIFNHPFSHSFLTSLFLLFFFFARVFNVFVFLSLRSSIRLLFLFLTSFFARPCFFFLSSYMSRFFFSMCFRVSIFLTHPCPTSFDCPRSISCYVSSMFNFHLRFGPLFYNFLWNVCAFL